ncbi:MAG: GTPase ObgE [Eubacteriales bacterium]|nr:GTPase ObgE [Sarcina sp.]MDO4417214.1 GTPase ObgE [Eubacteriales bacterium]
MFIDKARIIVSSGKGGDGHVSFRREKYVPAGGPDGGDGGKGGDVVFVVDDGLNTLTDFRHIRKYAAQHGEDGKKKRMAGKKGQDMEIKVPAGTVIREANSGKVIVDMSGDMRRYVILRGGRGGNGNMHYATSTMQAPKYAQPGQPSRSLELLLELKMIADVGLVGFPNVGKSTLLSMSSNAKPRIANYHFTTLQPILGVVDLEDAPGFVMADIPGLIEGAADGAGLGHEFLAHLERTKVLIHVVDAAGTEGRDPIEDIMAINRELARYKIDLSSRKQILAANKCDLIESFEEDGTGESAPAEDPIREIRAYCEPLGIEVFPISAATGKGVRELLYHVSGILSQMPADTVTYEQEYDPEAELTYDEAPYTVTYDPKTKEYFVEGPRIERMLGYTNLETEKGFIFFQKFLVDNGIIDELKRLGCKEGDTVRLYGHGFEFFE